MTEKMTTNDTPKGELLLYQTEDGRTRIECRFEGETVWLTQAMMAELFQTTPQNITQHLREIYAEGEFDEARSGGGSRNQCMDSRSKRAAKLPSSTASMPMVT